MSRPSPRPVRSSRFNGAARFCVRKWNQSSRTREPIIELQWGRTFLRAEMVLGIDARRHEDALASMGPHVFACGNNVPAGTMMIPRGLQWGRTFLRAEISAGNIKAGRPRSFNGAARFCVRKSPHGAE